MYTQLEKDNWKLLLDCEEDIKKLSYKLFELTREIESQHNMGICNHQKQSKMIDELFKDIKSLNFIKESAWVYILPIKGDPIILWN